MVAALDCWPRHAQLQSLTIIAEGDELDDEGAEHPLHQLFRMAASSAHRRAAQVLRTVTQCSIQVGHHVCCAALCCAVLFRMAAGGSQPQPQQGFSLRC